jgi:hypothetical protein
MLRCDPMTGSAGGPPKPMTEKQIETAAADLPEPRSERAPLPAADLERSRDVHAAAFEAALLDAARLLAALRDRHGAASDASGQALDRCQALLAQAGAAARAGRELVAWDCLQQIERERVPLLGIEERRAEFVLALAESRSQLDGWPQNAAEALAAGSGDLPGVAALQALLRNLHAARQERRLRLALVRQQLPMLATLLAGTVLFFGLWSLLGGFDWLARDDVEVTVGMMLVSGVLLGYFGGLVSFAFDWLRTDLTSRGPDLRTLRWLGFSRPLVGAAVAVPIVLFFEAGLVNVGDLSPTLILALCFVGGFAERWFVARIDRLIGGRS